MFAEVPPNKKGFLVVLTLFEVVENYGCIPDKQQKNLCPFS
jgi:hypothetical protein